MDNPYANKHVTIPPANSLIVWRLRYIDDHAIITAINMHGIAIIQEKNEPTKQAGPQNCMHVRLL